MTMMMASSPRCCCSNVNNLFSGSTSRSPLLLSPSSSRSSHLIISAPQSAAAAAAAASHRFGSRNLDKYLPIKDPSTNLLLCRAAEYVFPDPIPEFAEAETNKFMTHLLDKLTKKKKDLFGDSIEEVVRVCAEILSNFLHTEYGGPGTLLVIPFIDMADTLNERGLPGGPQAARAAVVWAQKHVDKDWNAWNKGERNVDPE